MRPEECGANGPQQRSPAGAALKAPQLVLVRPIVPEPSAQSNAAQLREDFPRRHGVRDSAVACLITNRLPGEVGKSLVRVGHTVHIFAPADRGAFALVSGHQFFGQLLVRGLALAFANGHQDPANSK